MVTTDQKKLGGKFLVEEISSDTVYIPEMKSAETSMMLESAGQFLATELEGNPHLETKEGIDATPELLKKCGDLGFLGLEVSEEYGGLNLSLKEVLHFVEAFSKGHSFAGALGVQTSIGIAPLLLYGSPFLKDKYLSSMLAGEVISAFALTEPNAGSDANAGTTKALIDDAGNYSISGQKAWISNAGLADIFIVFAKIEDDRNLSAFLVHKDFGGITLGPEEQKMGLMGWSTRQVFFDQTKVPQSHLLGERNKGLKIALNTLNTGRIKLGASCIGVSKLSMEHAVEYAMERAQFGKPIISYGAIREKIAKMTTNIFTNEAVVYRAAAAIDSYTTAINSDLQNGPVAKMEALKEFSIECAIAKVFGSEAQDTIVDEAVQIYGGMGFSAESPVERLYRGARISRIFEGTNEINRLVIVKEFFKKGMKGEIDMFGAFASVLDSIDDKAPEFSDDTLEAHQQFVKNMKALTVVTAGICAQKFMADLEQEQEVVLNIADLLIELYALESTVMRVAKLRELGKYEVQIHEAVLKAATFERFEKIAIAIKDLMACFDSKEEIKVIAKAWKKFGRIPHLNIKNTRRQICDFVKESRGVYKLS